MKKNILIYLFLVVISFTAHAQVVLYENFESCINGILPSGWSRTAPFAWQTANYECEFSGGRFSGDPVGSTYAMVNDNTQNVNNNNSSLRTPAFSLAGLTNPYLSFEYYFDSLNAETFELQISTDGGSNWSTLVGNMVHNGSWEGKGWKHWQGSLLSYAGNANVMIGFRYSDGGTWARGVGIDGVKVYDRKTDDAAVDYIKMGKYLGNGSTVSFYCRNMGSSTLTSVNAEYSINGTTPVVETISGLNLLSGEAAFVSFTTLASGIVPAAALGNIVVTVTKANGNPDLNIADNSRTAAFIGASKVVERNGLMEEFGNRGCPSCILFSQIFDPFALANGYNNPATHMNVVKYLLDFPTMDPSFNAQAKARQNYYYISGITAHFNNGLVGATAQNSTTTQLKEEMDDSHAEKAAVDIYGKYTVTGNTVTTAVTIKPFITSTANYKIYFAVTERYYYDSGAYSYQKHFYNTMRRMLPDANGYVRSALVDGDSFAYSDSYTFTVGNVSSGSYNFWGDPANSDLVVWIQDVTTNEVLQSVVIPANGIVAPSSVPRIPSTISKMSLSPNPATNIATLSFVTVQAQEAGISVYDMEGRVVYKRQQTYGPGTCIMDIPVGNLPQGIYTVKLQTLHNEMSQRLSVIK